ncbi:hypothetical protein K0M31_015345 [Melipona bicolor]|uniref:Uncharacterized protein n=1 Tax=Melipona bicolor TaxID=60889 RepID=A0AA40FFI2_9HYME|nr:hypothetical protein K0M31_015345 [Melipona bicolor]
MAELKEQPIRREHDSMDDFEHLEHVQDGQSSHPETLTEKVDKSAKNNFDMDQDMINFSLNQSSNEPDDSRKATMLLLESEKGRPVEESNFEVRSKEPEIDLLSGKIEDQSEIMKIEPVKKEDDKQEITEKEEVKETKVPDREPEVALSTEKKLDNSWNIVDKSTPVSESISKSGRKDESVSENVFTDAEKKERISAPETGESEFESEVEASPAKSFKSMKQEVRRQPVEEVEIAPKEIFSSMGIGELDAL